MLAIFVTLEVFQSETSTDGNTVQPLNIVDIFVTAEVFHLETSRLVRDEQL